MGSFSKTIPLTEISNMEAIIVLIQLLLFGTISPSPMTNGTEPIEATQRPIEIIQPCNPSPCGRNAECKERGQTAASCTCLPGLNGDPYVECKPECIRNTECPINKACVNQKCIDPCPGVCGTNATCSVQNHNPSCKCDPGYTGDPFRYCTRITTCVVNSDCSQDKACIDRKCQDPCLGKCPSHNGYMICDVINHVPICLHLGTRWSVEADDPCNPNPCGPNSNPPRNVGDRCQCTCLPEMIGSPPNCRPECVMNSDCPNDKVCVNNKCKDPCPGVCGVHASCHVTNHIPQCACDPGYSGNAFVACTRVTTSKTIDSLFGIDEDLLAEALILSSSGEAAEWNADKLGLYLRNGTANGAPLYYQMDSGETRYYLFKHDSNWIVGSDPSVNKGSFRNTEPSSSVPTKWWEYFAKGEWHHDDGIKVEKVIDANSSNICSSVHVSGDDEANRLAAEFLGKFDAVRGKYSAGRMVYHNEETGKNLEVRHGIVNWLILDDKPGSISSGGGANSMYPGDPLAEKSVLRAPAKKSWGFGLSSNYQYWTSLNLNFECFSP